jgi:CheY-like chemotaxis protein
VQGELPLAFSDPLRLRQIVYNLLSNAIKFTPRGGVEAELVPGEEGWCRFRVRDTGVGIERTAMGLIFERFRQVDGSMSRLAGGAGLGLSIVRQIAELLGGTITVESTVGEGSVFTVLLPLSAPEPGVAEPEALPRAVKASETEGHGKAGSPSSPEDASDDDRPLVLIVEDDPDTSSLLAESLSGAGYRVRQAMSGSLGLHLARQLEPAAITLDVMMPGMDGWRVLQALKSDPRTAQIPVVVCSIVDNRALGYRLGASDYLIKPVDPLQLSEALRSVSQSDAAEGDGYVLIVDDEHGARDLLATALQRAGYTIRTAASGETALRMISKSVPQAVLSDLMMPGGMSGYELIARLRTDPRTEHVPILVITGRDMTPDDRKLILGQITEVIRKGDLMMSDLESRLRESLEHLGVRPTHAEDSPG